jgi:hypothetical protein
MIGDIAATSFSNPWGGTEMAKSPTETMEELARKMHPPTQELFDSHPVLASSFASGIAYDSILNTAPSQQSLLLNPPVEVDPWSGTPVDLTPRLSNASLHPETMVDPFAGTEIQPISRVESPQEAHDSYHDSIQIQICPQEKTLFGHVNYTIVSSVHKSKVIRRYSDFLWLQDILLKKYPFRIITSLPPKKAVGADTAFLEKRRRGLLRFLNFAANHPALRSDEILIVFLTNDQTIQHYRSSVSVDLEEEITHLQITPEMVQQMPPEFSQTIQSFNPTLQSQLQDVCNICNALERLVVQLGLANQELTLISRLLRKTLVKSDCVFQNCADSEKLEVQSEILQEGVEQMDRTIHLHQYEVETGAIEKLKTYRDIVAGYQVMLGRRQLQLASLSIQATQKRIVQNKNRLVELTTRGSPQKEMDRITHLIDQVRETQIG